MEIQPQPVKKVMNLTTLIIIIFCIVLIGVLSYFTFKYISEKKDLYIKTKSFIPYIYDAKEEKIITNGSLARSAESVNFNYNFWMYISDYDYRNSEDKCIFLKGEKIGKMNDVSEFEANPKLTGVPGVYLLRNKNTLRVQVALGAKYAFLDKETLCPKTLELSDDEENNNNNSNNTNNNNTNNSNNNIPSTSTTTAYEFDKYMNPRELSQTLEEMKLQLENFQNYSVESNQNLSDFCEIPHIPLQTWVSVNIALKRNILTIYIDGELVKSCILLGPPVINNSDLYICPDGGFNGFLSNFSMSSDPISSNEIKNIYNRGPTLKPTF